jgi:P-type Ca2+ transporter type 2C
LPVTTTLSGLHAATRIPAQPNDPERRAFHAADAASVERYWASSIDLGLMDDEAEKRLARLGPNKLAEPSPPSLLARLVAQISDFTVLALLAAAAIAAGLSIFAPTPGVSFLGRFGDSIAILLIVVLNAILGLVQEARAEQALKKLRDMTSPNARVLREGKVIEVPSTALVPGDMVLLEEGDKVAADLRLVVAHDLDIEEAALTGESMAVTKDAGALLDPGTPLAERVNMAFMATRVARGRGRGMVCNTGMHTELGSIAGMLAKVETEATPLEKQLERFGRDIVLGCVAISAIVFLAGWWFGGYHPREMFLVAVALAVAAIPEGLPAITTITLALGTARMARRRALVRSLPAVETLGCAQVICTDKTGTLTQNAMTVTRLWVAGVTMDVGGGAVELVAPIVARGEPCASPDLDLALHAAAHATGARIALTEAGGRAQVSGDPTDAALLVLSRKGRRGGDHGTTIRGEAPFTSARRMGTVLTEENQRLVAFVRGAPEALLARCTAIRWAGQARPLGEPERRHVLDTAVAWGKEAMRVVALAVREDEPHMTASTASTAPGSASPPGKDALAAWETQLTFVALVGIVDPPRAEVAQAIRTAAAAGVRTVMITGDHPATARAIANQIGLLGPRDMVVTGPELEQVDQQRLESIIDRVRVVARATAADKLRMVEAYKSRGLVCAMTGDGVNDAPAVKAAHIGIAMGKAGTEVTKEAADLVIADDNYATIVAAIEEGRAIYSNIRKFIFFLLSSNAGIVLMVLCASLLGWQAPLTPIQILWINLITNGLPALALGVDPKDADQMSRPPRAMTTRLLSRREWATLAGLGAVMAAAALWVFWWAGGCKDCSVEELARARTLAFSVLAISPMFHALNCRSSTRSIFELGLFSNRAIWGAFGIGVLLQALAVYVRVLEPVFKTAPLGGVDLAVVVGLSAIPLVLGELSKAALRRF